ncbi:phosphotransferase [Actinoplanes sp. LDG1-01]|uniref:Phosphotransferase n=1 Tax=Paractinoplanes lichenicola TaxID=2802976 RepID=A0ABS1VRL8_9ACTN|nr:phosphotransferase [Actinoplanes lichenicola]
MGFGGYHWAAHDPDGARWFVTVDVRADHERLERALGTAVALGLPFVLAPVPARDGRATRRLASGHTLSVYPLVDGVAGDFGPHPAAERERVLDLLIALHRATPSIAAIPLRTDLRLPGRAELEAALDDLGGPWIGGPYSEAAREVLAPRAGLVRGWLAEFDRLAGAAGDPTGWVVTHGEPHPGNVLRATAEPPTPTGPDAANEPQAIGGVERLLLIDWDTVMLAPAERDLWMLTGAMFGEGAAGDDAALLGRYERETGRTVSHDLIGFYRLWWVLADLAIYADELRGPHGPGADHADSLTYLTSYLAG